MDRDRLLMTISVRQQRQVASAFDSASQLTLIGALSQGLWMRHDGHECVDNPRPHFSFRPQG